MLKPGQHSPLTLAFLGDGVYGLLVRERLCECDRPAGELHSRSVKLVNAVSQSRAFRLIEPMLSAVDLRPYIEKYRSEDGTPVIKHVSVGGESGFDARICDYSWVEDVHSQCIDNGITFYYHQTGAKLLKDAPFLLE